MNTQIKSHWLEALATLEEEEILKPLCPDNRVFARMIEVPKMVSRTPDVMGAVESYSMRPTRIAYDPIGVLYIVSGFEPWFPGDNPVAFFESRYTCCWPGANARNIGPGPQLLRKAGISEKHAVLITLKWHEMDGSPKALSDIISLIEDHL